MAYFWPVLVGVLSAALLSMTWAFARAVRHNRHLRSEVSVLVSDPNAPLAAKLMQTLLAVVRMEVRTAVDKRFDEMLAAGPKTLAKRATAAQQRRTK